MTPITPHGLFAEDETGAQIAQIGWVTPAKQEHVNFVLAQSNEDNGRSPWFWLRMQDGTLVLGLFPQGDTYMHVSDFASWEDVK